MDPVKQVPVIQVNQSGAELINLLLNLALKAGGLEALQIVNLTIQTINRPPQKQPAPEPKPEGNIIPIKEKKEK